MYCSIDECAEYAPCRVHLPLLDGSSETSDKDMYEYEVSSIATNYSHFTSTLGECDQEKHGDTAFDACTHFSHWRCSQSGFTFQSSVIEFVKDETLWHNNMVCGLCDEDIEYDNTVINIRDMCQFHDYCLQWWLHFHYPHVCPGCDKSRCRACWKCSY